MCMHYYSLTGFLASTAKPQITDLERTMLNSLLSHLKLFYRAFFATLAVGVAGLSMGCASTAPQNDPLEPINRKIFSFNDGLDRAVFKPTATAYKAVVPPVVQTSVSNFFSNLQTPWTSVNLVFQGRSGEGASTIARFAVNSTVGVLGVVDVAKDWGMPPSSEDFGLTLDTWGVGTGPFVVLPIFGPSNVRDALSIPVDSLGELMGEVSDVAVRNSMTALQIANRRAELLEMTNLLDQAALDKYVMVRDGHLKRRNRSSQQVDSKSDAQGVIPNEQTAQMDRASD